MINFFVFKSFEKCLQHLPALKKKKTSFDAFPSKLESRWMPQKHSIISFSLYLLNENNWNGNVSIFFSFPTFDFVPYFLSLCCPSPKQVWEIFKIFFFLWWNNESYFLSYWCWWCCLMFLSNWFSCFVLLINIVDEADAHSDW